MKPYLPKQLPIKNIDWVKHIGLIGKANAEVARFDGLLQSMQNPAVLLSPLTTQEAVLSSKIEGTKATLQEVLEFEADPKKQSEKYNDIQEILNYRKAMAYAIKDIKKISLSNRLIKNMHSILLNSVRGQNKDRGNFRNMQVHIGKTNKVEDATYIPPTPNNIPDLMSNLEKYFHFDDRDSLVQLGIIHAQFEIIHPFMDGNGRLGRILMPLFLYFKKTLSSPMFYLSSYFESHREEYYKRLNNISKYNDWDNWLEYFLEAVVVQSKENVRKAKKIHILYDLKKEKIANLTHSQFSIKALDFIFSNPVFTSSHFKKSSKIPIRSAERILKKLENGKVLQVIEKGGGKKATTYAFSKLINIVG